MPSTGAPPVKPQPFDVLLYGIDELDIFLAGVRIIETQVAHRSLLGVFLRYTEIRADGFGVSDVKVAVRLRRKTCNGSFAVPLCKVTSYPFTYEISFRFFVRHTRVFYHSYPQNQAHSDN